jgi:short-subunit dehydrogenase
MRFVEREDRFNALPGRAIYSASKYAIEAIHESLMQEVKTLRIKVLIVVPGAFRTPLTTRLLFPAAFESTNGLSEGYKGTALEEMVRMSPGITSISDAQGRH